MRSSATLTAGYCLLAFTGCTVGPNYQRPSVPESGTWKEARAAHSSALPQKWWRLFHDTELNALEERAVAANQDLHRAAARVTEARALAGLAAADRFPTITAGGGASNNRLSENRQDIPGQPLEYEDYSATLDLSYELDVWGRVRRSTEAAGADAEAAASDFEVVLLTLTADVARHYHLIRALDSERAVIDGTLALRRDAAGLQATRAKAGLANHMDATRAATELANLEADLQAVLRDRAQLEHALAVLCGQPPAGFSIAVRAAKGSPPSIPPGLPSSLLQRRPDIAAAEQSLHAATARIGVAKAAFFPSIRLTGSAGVASADLGSLVSSPSRIWSFGPSISLPIFDGGKNRANLKAAEARTGQSLAGYRGTILTAFREVEDALSDLSTLSAQSASVNRVITSAEDTAALAADRYKTGLTNYLDVVDAQRAALDAERQAARLNGQRAVATIQLAKALGGGWQAAPPPAPQAAPAKATLAANSR
jgi:outer membrane protein, multidrug efflux system